MSETTAENPNGESDANEANALAIGSQIVSGVASMTAVGERGKSDLSQRIEAAQIEAVIAAQAEGITDPDEIKARKRTATLAILERAPEADAG